MVTFVFEFYKILHIAGVMLLQEREVAKLEDAAGSDASFWRGG